MVDSRILVDTLIYSDTFSSPLTEDELYYFLHTDKPLKRQEFASLLRNSRDLFSFKKDFFALKNRGTIIDARVKNISRFDEKVSLAKKAAFYLSFIPTIYFVGLTGSVATGNPGRDDIDFFIITKKGTLFSTRLFAILILTALGVRRKKKEKDVENKICLNMFCDTIGMNDFTKSKNIYIAREIAQMIPLVDRDDTYKKFIQKNSWTRKFIAHIGLRYTPEIRRSRNHLEPLIAVFEPISEYISKKIMRMRTRDHPQEHHSLFFYPDTTERSILKRYRTAGGLL